MDSTRKIGESNPGASRPNALLFRSTASRTFSILCRGNGRLLSHTLSLPNSAQSSRGLAPPTRLRAASYAAVLLAINVYFARKLFFVDFTNNMQTNAGSFMAISRFILQHWPHLGWFPWWFNGEPFENSYTPMLHLVDAAFAWI